MWKSPYDVKSGIYVVDALLDRGALDEEEANQLRDRIVRTHGTVGKMLCDYCGKEVLVVRDDYCSSQWWGYLGNQATKPRTYMASPLIRAMRMLDGAVGRVWPENRLYNVHARIHTSPVKEYGLICSDDSLQMLCNDCFRKTYRRVKIYPQEGYHPWKNVERLEITVIPERGETVESVLRSCCIDSRHLVWEGKD